MSENDFYLLGPIFIPQIENLSKENYKNFCEFFFARHLIVEIIENFDLFVNFFLNKKKPPTDVLVTYGVLFRRGRPIRPNKKLGRVLSDMKKS